MLSVCEETRNPLWDCLVVPAAIRQGCHCTQGISRTDKLFLYYTQHMTIVGFLIMTRSHFSSSTVRISSLLWNFDPSWSLREENVHLKYHCALGWPLPPSWPLLGLRREEGGDTGLLKYFPWLLNIFHTPPPPPHLPASLHLAKVI